MGARARGQVWRYVFPREVTDGNTDDLSLEERAVVDRVLSMYDKANDSHLGDSLEKMSHQERPWASIKINEVITPQSMLDFYSLLQADPSMDHAAPVPDLADVSDRTFISDEDAEWIGSLLAD